MRAFLANLTWWEIGLIWCVLSVPVALVLGRFCAVGSGTSSAWKGRQAGRLNQ